MDELERVIVELVVSGAIATILYVFIFKGMIDDWRDDE